MNNIKEIHFGDFYKLDYINEELEFPPTVLNIYPDHEEADKVVKKALSLDLSKVERLRVDFTNICNVSCVFCPSFLKDKKSTEFSIELFKQLLTKISSSCNRIIIGCAYEPLVSKNLKSYFDILVQSLQNEFISKPTINITTNGLLLHKRDFQELHPYLDWITISLHSSLKETYEEIIKNSNFDKVVSNTKKFRAAYKDVTMNTEYVVNKINLENTKDFTKWVFDLGFDIIRIRRIQMDMQGYENSNLESLKQSDIDIRLSDEQWHEIVESLNVDYCLNLDTISTGNYLKTDVIEILNPHLKS